MFCGLESRLFSITQSNQASLTRGASGLVSLTLNSVFGFQVLTKMSEQRFIGYIQEPDVRDGVIIEAEFKSGFLRAVFDKRVVLVMVLTCDDRLFVIELRGVRSASITNVKGMRLHSLKEMYATPPFRRFLFVSSEEDNRHVEVVAREISSVEMTEDFVSRDAIAQLRNLFPRTQR
jgi:hypothetical protein